jgi:6-phosphogluconolactonase (cycloisomerase 2 family)
VRPSFLAASINNPEEFEEMFNHERMQRARPHSGRFAPRSVNVFRFAALIAVVALAATPQPAAAQRPLVHKAINIVYTESNDPNGNAIFAFSRASDGSLTPLPGSPFPTGGLGVTPTFALGPFDADQEVILNPQGTLLFAVNGGSDTIAVFNVNFDGSLTPVNGSPFPSGGSNPASLGLTGNILCVVNQDQDPDHPGQPLPNYTTLRVSSKGQLTPIPRAAFSLDLGSSPTQALPSPDGDVVFGCDFLGGTLRSFKLRSDGRLALRAAQGLPLDLFTPSGAPPLPLGLAVHPDQSLLYVGLVTINHIAVYNYTDSGQLNFLQAVPDKGNGVCWLTINNDATRLYASNTGDPSVGVFDISKDPRTPIQIQNVLLNNPGGGGGFEFRLDSTNQWLHVVTQQSSTTATVMANALHTFKVAVDGTLTEVPSSPTVLPAPNLVRPQGVAAL